MLFKNCTIGSDPELFLIDKTTGKVVSSIGIIPGEKDNAFREKTWPKGFGLEIDNILAEFNIPAVKTKNAWLKNMNFMKNYIRNFAQQINPNLDIMCTASMMVDDDQLNSEAAKLFGCDPDYNAYTEKANPKPQGDRGNLRSAGCHIHIGYPKCNAETSIRLVKYLDAFVGVPSILLDTDTKRRSLYGKAGSFRLQPWGVEYRVLSSKFIENDDLLTWVWYQVEQAVNACHYGLQLPPQDLVIKAINESDKELAKQLIKKYNLD
jgi:hypothetical protein